MKKLVFGLIATVMFGFIGNAQVSKPTDSGQVLLNIPKEFKSIYLETDKDSGAKTHVEFFKKYNVNITVIVDKSNKIIKFSVPKDSIDSNLLLNIASPMGQCVGGCGGTWACFFGCLLEIG